MALRDISLGLQNWVAIRAERTWPQLAASLTRSRMTQSRQNSVSGCCNALVTDGLFADRSRLIEISEARTTFGKNFRPQLDRVCAQIGVNGLAVEVARQFYFQPSLL